MVQVIRNVGADIGNDHRYTVDYRIFELTGRIGANQDALNYILVMFPDDRRDFEAVILLTRKSATWADRTQLIKMTDSQKVYPINTVGQQGGKILPVGPGIGAMQPG